MCAIWGDLGSWPSTAPHQAREDENDAAREGLVRLLHELRRSSMFDEPSRVEEFRPRPKRHERRAVHVVTRDAQCAFNE